MDNSRQSAPRQRDPRLVFVVQTRQGSQDYYALRLETRNTLRSWIIPKGPSADPSVEKLAIQVDATPKVSDEVIWDKGWYEPVGPGVGPNDRMTRGLKRGAIRFILYGKILKGGYSLVRFRQPDQWLLTKRNDMHARKDPVSSNSERPRYAKATTTPS